MRVRLPPSAPGMRIGLYGGSFNPPHAGHRHVGRTALRRLGLDRLWWLVTPGNPLKSRGALAPLAERRAAAAAMAGDPRIVATGFEAALGARYTVETLRYLVARRPGVRFVWIMGADSLDDFHRWRAWSEILRLMPVAVVDRPGATFSALRARAARRFASARLPEAAAIALPDRPPPAWVFLHGPRSTLSSTQIRSRRGGPY